MNLNANYWIALLMSVASGLFLAGVTSFSPIYFILGLALILYFLKLVIRYDFENDNIAIYSLFICVFSFLSQSFIPNTKFSNTLGLALPYFFYFVIYQTAKTVNKFDVIKLSGYMLISHTVLFAIDAIWRLTHPTLYAMNAFSGHTRELTLAYMFKFNSLMYIDANFVGVQICLTYFFSLYLRKENLSNNLIKNVSYLLFVLVILTTSRSAIVTLIFYSLLFNKISFPFKISKRQIFWLVMVAIVLLLASIVLLRLVARDDSFSSKFIIINLATEFLSGVPLKTLLFGIGMGNTFSFIGLGAHNLIVTLVMETGIIGFSLFLAFIYFISKKTSGKTLYIILPLITMGFSAASLAFPFLLTQLCLIYILEEKKKTEILLPTLN